MKERKKNEGKSRAFYPSVEKRLQSDLQHVAYAMHTTSHTLYNIYMYETSRCVCMCFFIITSLTFKWKVITRNIEAAMREKKCYGSTAQCERNGTLAKCDSLGFEYNRIIDQRIKTETETAKQKHQTSMETKEKRSDEITKAMESIE